MKSNYKRLGDYIRQVDVRNRDLEVTELVGLTIDKACIPSVANTIGTDLSNYKVISHNQFACSLMQVSRDEKMPIAIYKGDKAIMSPAYPMFEVCRTDELLPEFLMMWFSRKEFDREVTFWAVGGVRGSLTWEDFINLRIPVPPIEEQRKIVAEYQAVERRIENNRRLIVTLEATAQTIYRKMFVDNIDPNNLPEGWRYEKLGSLIMSFSKTHLFPNKTIIFLNTSDIYNGDILCREYQAVDSLPGQAKKQIQKGDILYSEIRPKNLRFALVREDGDDFVVSTKLMVLRCKDTTISNLRIYNFLTQPDFIDEINKQAEGRSGTFPQITFEGDIESRQILLGTPEIEHFFEEQIQRIYSYYWNLKDETMDLSRLSEILLSKLSNL